MRHDAQAEPGDTPLEIVVGAYRRMAVIARDPHVRVVPVSEPFRVATDASDELIDDADGVANDRRVVALRVRALVDSGECGEDEIGTLVAHALNDFLDDVAVEVEPA